MPETMSKEGAMGTAVHPYIMAAVFDAEATQALALAFDDIGQAHEPGGDRHPCQRDRRNAYYRSGASRYP